MDHSRLPVHRRSPSPSPAPMDTGFVEVTPSTAGIGSPGFQGFSAGAGPAGVARVATSLPIGLPPLLNFKHLHAPVYSPGKEPRSMTSLLAEGDIFGAPRYEGAGRLDVDVQTAYPNWGVGRDCGFPRDGFRMGANGERPQSGPPPVGAHSMLGGVGGGSPNTYTPMEGRTSPTFAHSPSTTNHIRPQNLYSSDPGVNRGAASMLGPHANVNNSDVPMPNHSHDSSVEEPVIDGAFGGAFTEPAMDIAGTQSGRLATVEVADDEGGAHCSDATPPAGSRKRAVGEEGGSRGGQSKAKAKERKPEWTDKESMALVRLLFEEDCTQQSRRGRQKIRSRRKEYDWIIGKMVEQGFPKRDMEDCEAKYYALLDKAKKIRDYSGESGKPSYWDMSCSEKKENGLSLTYEKHMFEALQWKLGKADGSCEDLMHSVNLQRGQTSTVTDDEDTGGTSENGGGRRKADTDSAEGYKSRRTVGVSDHKRRSAVESSSDASTGGSFADIAHALVDANDRHAERIAGSFAQAMDGMNKNMVEGNQTLLQCFAVLSNAMVGQPPSVPPGGGTHCERGSRQEDGR
ncbi:hypothetical protein CBR_g41295 [Chara braunii]|uniref:Myb-like domain-containing protein n=1 Tax=Chara braunii TaxID=69332 RepID=A0A388LVL6_CHABU|nr:hypothetical protein CBR_g41295 [Chara braunii]|eukprot:GBG86301.1 hypothetical protein CBR_g41295 [Chara braunii]